MRLWLLAGAIALAGSLPAADSELLSLAPPDAQVVAGVNVEQAKLSPIGQLLLTRTVGKAPDSGLQKLIDATGFDPRRDIREVLVAARPGTKSGVLLAHGTFDVPRITEAALGAGGSSETYKGVTLIHAKAQQEKAVGFPDSTIAIAGEAAEVRAAIDRRAAPSAISPALAAQVSQLSASEDIWFVCTAPLSQLYPPPAAEPGKEVQNPMAVFYKVQQASGGLKLGTDLVLNMQVLLPTAQDAATLVETVKSFLTQMAVVAPNTFRPAAELLKNVDVTADGQVAKLSLIVPQNQVQEMLKQGAAGRLFSAVP